MLKSLGSLLTFLVLGYALIVLLVYFFQQRLVYFPSRELVNTPANVGLVFEDVGLTTEDGIRLHAWYMPASKPTARTVLFLHGNAGNISHRLQTFALWQQLGLNVLALDYRGYGRSAGEPSAAGTGLDARAAWRYLQQERKIPASYIIVHGRSLGGAVALALTRLERNVAAVVVESTFTSMVDIGREKYPWLPVSLINRVHYPSRESIRQLRAPVLIAHSQGDRLIPFAHGRALYAAANDPKSFLEMRGGHNDGFVATGDTYRVTLGQFVEQHLPAD